MFDSKTTRELFESGKLADHTFPRYPAVATGQSAVHSVCSCVLNVWIWRET